jgi:hypothetical protein
MSNRPVCRRHLRSVLSFRYRLPLHIERRICSTAFERIDVVDDVSGTASAGSPVGRARMLTLEVVLSSRAAPVAAMGSKPRTVRVVGKSDGAVPVPRSSEGIERGESAKQKRNRSEAHVNSFPFAASVAMALVMVWLFTVPGGP